MMHAHAGMDIGQAHGQDAVLPIKTISEMDAC
jgi:hypothetical protein